MPSRPALLALLTLGVAKTVLLHHLGVPMNLSMGVSAGTTGLYSAHWQTQRRRKRGEL